LHCWWDHIGPDFGYFPNPSKICLIVKPSFVHWAKTLFRGTGVIISDSGKLHLGSVLGTDNFFAAYVRDKVVSWVSAIEKLLVIAIAQPQAAFAAFTHMLYIIGLILPKLLQGPYSFFSPA